MGEARAAAWKGESVSALALPAREGPFNLDQHQAEGAAALRRLAEDHFEKGGGRICVPLFSAGDLQGLMMVGDRVAGMVISAEDLDLLKCMSVQVASRLRGIRLSDQLLQAKQMEAFQTMSAFLVHDLKNTASLLSLMLQNMASHFGDPAFREDALRGLSTSVAHIKDLLGRLTTLRQGLEIRKTEVDVNEVVESTLAGLSGSSSLTVEKQLASLDRIAADREQLGKVLANLLLNAKEAAGDAGRIRIQTRQENGWLTLGVEDNGCGMSPEFIRQSLFKPFQTTKPQGLGIGMFQSKMIVEAHQGRIEVESEPGKGTRFRVVLPVQPISP
jgi:putative PEP-CTERM system histidine kinase